MGVEITILPHRVFDEQRKHEVEFEQNRIFCGQRILGYLGKDPSCGPTITVRHLPEDVIEAVNEACDKFHKRGKYAVAGDAEAQPSVRAAVSHPVGSDPKKEKPAPLPPTDPAADAALEASIAAEIEEPKTDAEAK